MDLFLYKLFFNGDPTPGKITKAFGITVSESGISSAHPIWLLALITLGFAIIGYLIGSLNFSLLISKHVFHDDVRRHGSHNAGSTNMKRVFGLSAGLMTLLGDALKGAVAALIPMLLIGHTAGYIAGFFCILGHCFPIFFKFKGGKGVATSIGVILAADPIVGIIILIIFAVTVVGTKYVSLGSIISALLFPLILDRVYSLSFGGDVHPPMLMIVSALLITISVVVAHHENIKRLLSGTESKFSFRKKPDTGGTSPEKSASRSLHHIDDDDDDVSDDKKD